MKIRIEVGQPKGFDSGDKTNVIIGTILEELSGSREVEALPTAAAIIQSQGEQVSARLVEYWFVVSCNPFELDGMKVSSLLFVPRYKSKKPPVEFFKDGEQLVIHGVWRADGQPWDVPSIKGAQDGVVEMAGMIIASARKAD